MSQQIVKLIPIGNAESHLFAFQVVGGAPGFPGFSVEEFTFTTDGSGQGTCVLSRPPAAVARCYCHIGKDERVVAPLSISSSTHLLVQVRKLVYDKPASSKTSTVHSGSAPVTVTASPQVTGDTAPAALSTGPSSTTGAVGGGAGAAVTSVGGVSTTVSAHHHTMDFLYDHTHDITFASTSLVAAVTELVTVLVLYA